MLPDRFSGTIAYNDNIGGSTNFQMPALFGEFDRELLLVGINFNFLLNLKNNTENFAALLDALAERPERRVRILVADLWDEKILYTYDRATFGSGRTEFLGLDASLRNVSSPHYLDTFARSHLNEDAYARVRNQLRIKKIPLLADTFWFVDPDGTHLTGDMLFALMTSATGRDRPIFYVNQSENPTLYSKHYDMCRAAYDLSAETLWPPAAGTTA
ncbi:hypothetical protein ACFVYA_37645 [Amycolatopsis sp. NPDC058278]|uniref:hypothetical protein n=1 Tax=Amycolatopsis sp. NPDC058278 TaxID=3346417 RepID=UPI0036DEEEAE